MLIDSVRIGAYIEPIVEAEPNQGSGNVALLLVQLVHGLSDDGVDIGASLGIVSGRQRVS